MKYLLIFLIGCAAKEKKIELPKECANTCQKRGMAYDFFYIQGDLFCQCNDGFIEKVVK